MQNSGLLLGKWKYGLSGAVILLLLLPLLPKKKGIPVTVISPCIRSITETVPASGYLKPLSEIALSPDVSGEIVELLVSEGDPVRKGDLLLKIRQDLYLAALDQAEAALQAQQAQLRQETFQFEQNQRRYQRSQRLFEQGSISKVEFEDAEVEYHLATCRLETATHNVANAKATRNQARESLRKTLVHAPMDGIVSRLSVEQGERVVGTSQMAGTEMLRIADFRQMEVRVEVSENDILKIKLGDTARITIDAYDGRQFTGVVTQMANSAFSHERSSGIPTFPVRILLLPDSYADLSHDLHSPFRPGMSASIEIETCRRDSILTLPLSCFVQRPGERQAQVFLYSEDSHVYLRPVSTGIQDMNHVEVLSGLQISDRIVSGPYTTLHDVLNDGDFVSLQHEYTSIPLD